MSKYQQFVFKDYRFDSSTKTLQLWYGFDDALEFCETYTFDFDFANYDEAVLDRALQMLFFMAGVSYYKAYLPPNISVAKGDVDDVTAGFLERTWQKGLGEFFYVNKLDPNTAVRFPATSKTLQPLIPSGSGLLVGIGGGKDSLVSIELLRGYDLDIATWSLNHRPQLTPLIERIGLPHYWVEREWDTRLLELNKQGALNGHVPISAIFAAVGSIVAVLTGRREVVVSNEQSANEPTLYYRGVAINHQYSKSQEFEMDYQALLKTHFGDNLQYYSLLRPLSELAIAEIFSKIGLDTYHDVFSSCNRAFRHDSNRLFWDGTCPKCAFVFLALTPFVAREKLESLFEGKNLLLDPDLEVTYRQLLGIEGDKPLECVGEVQESRAAMRLAQEIYPELAEKYQFDLPESYNYHELKSDAMPSEMRQKLEHAIANL